MALVIGEVPRGFQDGHPENAVAIPLPPQNGGAIGWGGVYLSFGADFADALLRVAIWSDKTSSWRVQAVKVPSAGGRVNVGIQDGDSKVSVGRTATGPTDKGTCPVGWMLETTLKA